MKARPPRPRPLSLRSPFCSLLLYLRCQLSPGAPASFPLYSEFAPLLPVPWPRVSGSESFRGGGGECTEQPPGSQNTLSPLVLGPVKYYAFFSLSDVDWPPPSLPSFPPLHAEPQRPLRRGGQIMETRMHVCGEEFSSDLFQRESRSQKGCRAFWKASGKGGAALVPSPMSLLSALA